MPAPPNEFFSAFAFIGFVLCAIPFPWHLEAWNTGTCLYMFWTGLGCLNFFINSVIWNGNAINWAPVWCDISSRFIVALPVALPASSLCINRRLYYIATANTVTTTRAEKRRAIMIDLAIGVGLPVLQMILQYIPQGHRFDIYEDIGCWTFTYNTWVARVLVDSWPLAIGCVSAMYCILSIRAFNKRRMQFKELLSSNSNLSSNRYFRLMCLAGIECGCTIPLASYVISLNVLVGMSPWISWADTHYNFSRVGLIPAVIWRNRPYGEVSMELSRWFLPICAFIFFGFFGFADEARKHYRLAATSVAKKVGYTSMGTKSGLFSSIGKWGSTSSNGALSTTEKGSSTLPVYVSKQTVRKHDSLESFTNMTASFNGDDASFKEKSFNGTTSYGELDLRDVGGLLSDTRSDSGPQKPPALGSSSSEASKSSNSLKEKVPKDVDEDEDDDHRIEISSVRYSSAAFPEPSHVKRGSDNNV